MLVLALWAALASTASTPAEGEPSTPGAPAPDAEPAADQPIEALALASQEPLGFYELLDELLADVVIELERLPLSEISPMALLGVQLSSNLSPELEEAVAVRLQAALGGLSGLSQIHCVACGAVRSRVEGGEWVVTRGVVSSQELRQLGSELGVQSFLSVHLEYLETVPEEKLALSLRLVRPATSAVILARRLVSDETTAALARDGKRRQSTEARRAELEALLLEKPHYGHAAITGILRVPYRSKTFDGMISGISLAYRLYEMFGERRRHLFGLQMEGFMDPSLDADEKGQIPAAGALFTAVYMRSFLPDDLRLPVVRAGFNAGGFVGGTLGNTITAGPSVEVLLRHRLALSASVFYVVPTEIEELESRLGGWSYRVGGSFNWE